MKKILSIILSIILTFSFTSCTKAEATWQEQYDLGLRYLSELEYESAIQAFNSAIEIDPKNENAYISLADVYIAQGNKNKAAETIDSAISEIGNIDSLINKKEEIESNEETFTFDDGSFIVHEYDDNGRIIQITSYNPDGSFKHGISYSGFSGYFIPEYDNYGNMIKRTDYNPDGTINYITDYIPNSIYGNPSKKTFYDSNGNVLYWDIEEYDENDRLIKSTYYNSDGTIGSWFIFDYDENGNRIKRTDYNADGSINTVFEF